MFLKLAVHQFSCLFWVDHSDSFVWTLAWTGVILQSIVIVNKSNYAKPTRNTEKM